MRLMYMDFVPYPEVTEVLIITNCKRELDKWAEKLPVFYPRNMLLRDGEKKDGRENNTGACPESGC